MLFVDMKTPSEEECKRACTGLDPLDYDNCILACIFGSDEEDDYILE